MNSARSWGRTPTVTELAVAVELPEEEVKDLLCRARQPVSLETKVGDGDDTELLDLLAGGGALPEEMVDGECLKGDLRNLVEQLPETQSQVLKMRFGDGGRGSDEPHLHRQNPRHEPGQDPQSRAPAPSMASATSPAIFTPTWQPDGSQPAASGSLPRPAPWEPELQSKRSLKRLARAFIASSDAPTPMNTAPRRPRSACAMSTLTSLTRQAPSPSRASRRN